MFRLQLKQNKSLQLGALQFLIGLTLLPSSSWGVSFEEVYEATLKNSSQLAVIRAKTQQAKAISQSEESKFLPRAGIEMRYESFDSDFEKRKGGTSNAFLEWNLFRGFQDVSSKTYFKTEAEITQLEQRRFENNLSWTLKALYSQAQAKAQAVLAYRSVIEMNQKALESVRLRRASGRISEADLLEFVLFDNRLRQDLITLETEAEQLLSQLEAFSGLSPITSLTSELKPSPLNLEQLDIKKLLSEKNSLLEDFRKRNEATESRKKLSKGGYLPEVNFNATYGSLGLRETTVSPETSLGLTAKWELFSGLTTINDQRSANAEWIRARAELAQNEILLLSRAMQLRQNLKNLLLRYELEEKNQKNLEGFLKAVQEEYRRGVKNSADLKDALEMSLETQIGRSQLRADYFEARAELQDILGIELN
ncbi:MAG: TolC family protein [Pseudobdellovibrionaceae bacterium]